MMMTTTTKTKKKKKMMMMMKMMKKMKKMKKKTRARKTIIQAAEAEAEAVALPQLDGEGHRRLHGKPQTLLNRQPRTSRSKTPVFL
jgi:hypothetical protein